MDSRAFIVSVAGAFLAASLNVGAQRTEKVAHIGLLCSTRCDGPYIDALRDGLRSAGWVEGRNLQIEYRAAGGQTDRLPALAQELVELKPDLIVTGSPQPSRAGGNVTGVATVVMGGFIGKTLEVLKQTVPKATRIAALLNPTNEVSRENFPLEAPPAARQLGVQLQVLEVSAPEGIERAIDAAVQAKADALRVVGDAIFHNPAQRIPDLAARVTIIDPDDKLAAHLGDGKDPDTKKDKPDNKTNPALFAAPHAMCVDSHGDLYVVEWVDFGRPRKFKHTPHPA